MPNHVAHRVTISGAVEDVRLFKNRCIVTRIAQPGDRRQREFDFNSLIPMPETIHDMPSSSVVDEGLLILGYRGDDELEKQRATAKLQEMLEYPWVKALKPAVRSISKLIPLLIDRHPECLELGERALKNIEQYGHRDWYHWSVENWGTKWNSYDLNVEQETETHMEFTFDTAWSHPQPVFEKLAQEFPTLQVDVLCFDEGWGFAGSGTTDGATYLYTTIEPTDAIYERVYGHAPEKNEEDE